LAVNISLVLYIHFFCVFGLYTSSNAGVIEKSQENAEITRRHETHRIFGCLFLTKLRWSHRLSALSADATCLLDILFEWLWRAWRG